MRLGASSVTLGGLLKHLAWVEELYFQNRLAGRQSMAPFDQLDLERDWEDWAWSTAADDTPDALRALWVDTVHRSRDALAEALSRGGLEQTTQNGMSLRRLLADMIEEYARQTGHADLLREQVDRAPCAPAPLLLSRPPMFDKTPTFGVSDTAGGGALTHCSCEAPHYWRPPDQVACE